MAILGDDALDAPTSELLVTSVTNDTTGVFTLGEVNFAVDDQVFANGFGGMSGINGQSFQVISITPDGPDYDVVIGNGGVPLDTSALGDYTGGGTFIPAPDGGISTTGVATCYNNLFDTGAFNTIAWTAVAGAQRYNVYKLSNGLFGYIGQTTNLSFVDDNIAADISKTPPLQSDPFSGEGKYPAAVGYFEQRRCFAGTEEEPAYFWATRSATESSLAYSIPPRDDDSIRFRIAARERCAIRHIVPMANLVLLTESSEWRVAPANGEVLTPDVSVRAQSFIGASEAQPAVVNNTLVFAAARGGHVRELAYNSDAGGYINGDLCLRAPHLFDGLEIVDMAYAKSPVPIVWCVSSDGRLLGLTYVPEQEVGAWHWHDTQDGLFESICVVPEGDADVLYAVVNRDGERFIERMEPRRSQDDASGFFVDSGLIYLGAPETDFAGLDHLEGKTVSVIADGAVLGEYVVEDGGITIPDPAELVHVGLPITADIETLPLAFEMQGYGQGRPKNINAAWLRFYHSRSVFAGPSFSNLTEYKPRSTEAWGAPPGLIDGEVKISFSPSWSSEGGACIRHSHPLPLTLVGITFEFAVGG